MRLFYLLWVTLLLLALPCHSQQYAVPKPPTGRTCGVDQYQKTLEQLQPGTLQQQQRAREAVHTYLRQSTNQQQLRKAETTITIPVVFHILYNTPEQNIPDTQILSQLAVLNEDFRRANADRIHTPSHFQAIAGDAGIEFCLASTGPDGEPTTGITRTQTSVAAFSASNNRIKRGNNGGADAWDRDQYLNIWVGNIGDDILGWATFPEASTASQNDGVVLHYQAVGAAPHNPFDTQFNRGRTATHEIGHWLGLRHIWGDYEDTCSDSDGIDDTPNQKGSNYNCPSGILISCNNGPYGDMWQNYMDYSDDACMNLFTQGQVAYMRAVLHSLRSKLLTSVACTGGLRSGFEAATDTLVAAGETVQFQDKSVGVKPASWFWEFEGGVPATSTQQHPIVTYPKPGNYSVTLTIANSQMSSTETRKQYIEVTPDALTVYPVPASDYIIIEQPARVKTRHVELISRLGQVVLSKQVAARKAELKTIGLPGGIYILRISSSEGVSTRKITIIR